MLKQPSVRNITLYFTAGLTHGVISKRVVNDDHLKQNRRINTWSSIIAVLQAFPPGLKNLLQRKRVGKSL